MSVDGDDVGDLRDVEQRSDARQEVLAGRRVSRQHVRVTLADFGDEQRHVLGQLMSVGGVVCKQHFLHAADRGRLIGNGFASGTGNQHVDIAAEFFRGGDDVQRDGLERRVVVFRNDENTHEITFASLRNLSTSSSTVFNFDAGLPRRRRLYRQHSKRRRGVDAEVGGRDDVHRLFLGLHDVRQRCVTRFVEAQVGRNDCRQTHRNRLQTAVDFAGDRQSCRRQR